MPPTPLHPKNPRDDDDDAPGFTNAIRLAPGVELAPSAVKFSATRSSGPGGQNVNKRSTKVELRTHIDAIPISEGAKHRLAKLLGERLTDDGEIVITSDEHRSQRQNRDGAIDRLSELVRVAMVTPKRRVKTRPSRGSKERRLTEKKQRGETKKRRGARGDE